MSRSTKADQLRKNCSDPNFEVTVVDDLVAGDFSEALRGMLSDLKVFYFILTFYTADVTGVIHVASPMPWVQDPLEV